jgi:hypothetical protein
MFDKSTLGLVQQSWWFVYMYEISDFICHLNHIIICLRGYMTYGLHPGREGEKVGIGWVSIPTRFN